MTSSYMNKVNKLTHYGLEMLCHSTLKSTTAISLLSSNIVRQQKKRKIYNYIPQIDLNP